MALACGLRQFGVDVRIVDAASGPATTSRALGVQPRGAEVLARLGALGDLPDKAVRLKQLRINGEPVLDLGLLREAGRLVVSQACCATSTASGTWTASRSTSSSTGPR